MRALNIACTECDHPTRDAQPASLMRNAAGAAAAAAAHVRTPPLDFDGDRAAGMPRLSEPCRHFRCELRDEDRDLSKRSNHTAVCRCDVQFCSIEVGA
jgi:hypothetical protein